MIHGNDAEPVIPFIVILAADLADDAHRFVEQLSALFQIFTEINQRHGLVHQAGRQELLRAWMAGQLRGGNGFILMLHAPFEVLLGIHVVEDVARRIVIDSPVIRAGVTDKIGFHLLQRIKSIVEIVESPEQHRRLVVQPEHAVRVKIIRMFEQSQTALEHQLILIHRCIHD